MTTRATILQTLVTIRRDETALHIINQAIVKQQTFPVMAINTTHTHTHADLHILIHICKKFTLSPTDESVDTKLGCISHET